MIIHITFIRMGIGDNEYQNQWNCNANWPKKEEEEEESCITIEIELTYPHVGCLAFAAIVIDSLTHAHSLSTSEKSIDTSTCGASDQHIYRRMEKTTCIDHAIFKWEKSIT